MAFFKQSIKLYNRLSANELKSQIASYGLISYGAHRWQEAKYISEELAMDLPDSWDIKDCWA